MNKAYFITATGTDIGKTVITCALAHALKKQGKNVSAIKPVISGWQDNDESMDTMQILQSLGQNIDDGSINSVSPWRLKAPLSPNIAAAKEGLAINFDEVVKFCKKSNKNAEILLIEGAGGVFVPLNEEKTIADLIKALNIPAIVVAGTYLGAINHTIATIKACKQDNIDIKAIILNESEESAGLDETLSTLKKFTDIPIRVVHRLANSNNLWKDVGGLMDVL